MICNRCSVDKDPDEFYGREHTCKPCFKARQKVTSAKLRRERGILTREEWVREKKRPQTRAHLAQRFNRLRFTHD